MVNLHSKLVSYGGLQENIIWSPIKKCYCPFTRANFQNSLAIIATIVVFSLIIEYIVNINLEIYLIVCFIIYLSLRQISLLIAR